MKKRASKWKLLIKLDCLKTKVKSSPTPELIDFFERRQAFKFLIGCNQQSIERMLDYSMGFKSTQVTRSGFYRRTPEDEKRMVRTIKNLHEQNRALRKRMKEELENVNSD